MICLDLQVHEILLPELPLFEEVGERAQPQQQEQQQEPLLHPVYRLLPSSPDICIALALTYMLQLSPDTEDEEMEAVLL